MQIKKKQLPIGIIIILVTTAFELPAVDQAVTTNRFWSALTSMKQSATAYVSSIRNFWTNLRPAYQYTVIGAGLLLTTAAIIHTLRSKQTPSNKPLGPIMERYVALLTEKQITSKLQELNAVLNEMIANLLNINKNMLENFDQLDSRSIDTYKSSLANIEFQFQNSSRELNDLQPHTTSNQIMHRTISDNQYVLNKSLITSIDLARELRMLYLYCSSSLKQDPYEYLEKKPCLNEDEIKKIEKYIECKIEQKRVKNELISIITKVQQIHQLQIESKIIHTFNEALDGLKTVVSREIPPQQDPWSATAKEDQREAEASK